MGDTVYIIHNANPVRCQVTRSKQLADASREQGLTVTIHTMLVLCKRPNYMRRPHGNHPKHLP